MTPNEFAITLNKNAVPPICVLYGEEPFLLERSLNLLLEKAFDQTLKDFNFNLFYGNESKGVDIVDSAQTLPMFSERRAVLVKRADALKVDATEFLLPYLEKPSNSTCLIFVANKFDQRKKFFQSLKKNAVLVEHKRLYDNKILGEFIKPEAKRLGKTIESDAAELLCACIGNNLQELAAQLEKIVLYVGKRASISIADVTVIASSSKAFTAFELAGFLGMKQLKNSLSSLSALFRDGSEIPLIVGALSQHFRKIWRVRELLEKKVSQGDMAKIAGISPFFLGDMISQAKNFSSKELNSLFVELQRCDYSSKSGGNAVTLLNGFVFQVCTGIKANEI